MDSLLIEFMYYGNIKLRGVYMAKPFAKKIYNSKQWKDCRKAYIASVGGLCETCLENDDITAGYIVHHKKHLTPNNINDYYIVFGFDNLKLECKECHDKNDGHGVTKQAEVMVKGLMFDKNGDLIKK